MHKCYGRTNGHTHTRPAGIQISDILHEPENMCSFHKFSEMVLTFMTRKDLEIHNEKSSEQFIFHIYKKNKKWK